MAVEPEVCFNMDCANGRTSARFCYEAASVLKVDSSEVGQYSLDYDATTDTGDQMPDWSDEVDHWIGKLESAGYYVWWNAGDVVVWDLRPLSEDDRETFCREMENM